MSNVVGVSRRLAESQHTLTRSKVGSQHVLTRSAVASQHVITKAVVASQHVITKAKIGSQHVLTQGIVQSQHTLTKSSVNTTTQSQHVITKAKIDSQHTLTKSSINGTVQSQHVITKAKIGSQHVLTRAAVASQHVITKAATASQHVLTQGIVRSQFTLHAAANGVEQTTMELVPFAPTTAGAITADPTESEISATATATTTSYTEMHAYQITVPGSGTISVINGVFVDFSWNSQMSGAGAKLGSTKWMVDGGTGATFASAVNVTDVVNSTATKTEHNRSGEIKVADMDTLPFTLYLAGKTDNAGDTNTAKLLSSTRIKVTYKME